MSGLEVVGVVLGALPVAVRALQGYTAVLSSMKHAQRNLKTLIRDLETEQIRLQTTCELLLDGVAPPSVIDQLIQTPFGPEWKPYNDQLRLRLWTTSGKFEEQVAELQRAAQELRTKLGLEADGSTKLTDRRSISQELKRGTSFTLRKKDYDGILTRIKSANSVLHELAGQNCGLEPTRRHRSQARLIRLIRALARSIFNALACSSDCSCPRSHDICLELEPRDVILVPTDSEDEVAKTFNFHLAMSSHGNRLGQKQAAESQDSRWESIHAKVVTLDEPATPSSASALSLPSLPLTMPEQPKSPRRITWAKSFSSRLTRTQSAREYPSSQTKSSVTFTQTQLEVELSKTLTLSSASSSGNYAPASLSNLCQVLFTSGKATAPNRFGYIADEERIFELLQPPQNRCESQRAFSLRTLLSSDKSTTLPPLDYPQKLKLAVALAISILHLFGTPWLSTASVITLDNVLFFHQDDPTSDPDPERAPYQPFITQTLTQKPLQGPLPTTHSTPRPVNLAVLSLGALLIQVILGRVVSTLEMTEHMDMNAILAKHEAGTRLSSEVLEKGGIHYDTVVKWCLHSVLEVGGLENEAFCQKFYGAVVAKLKEDERLTTGG
ncbi:hypothetical protein B0T16DRAFT_442612 [Cercophora newfieldiana]|uniref:DUF7580 domain-containing protein n=1 Tax=Cercophora newfieldiana TaxID=92897 RepID=A0AA39YGF2_9PEZI|nr:hypothetical protein B0T16DRAFT_442612 [Cercophora newfieldiana]